MPRRKTRKTQKAVHLYPEKGIITILENDPGVNKNWTKLVLDAYPVKNGDVLEWSEATKVAAILAAHNILVEVTPVAAAEDN